MLRPVLRTCLILVPVLAPLAACGPTYSPNTYAANAAQQANKADQGIIIGVRPVRISAAGTVGTVTGAAAGGLAGSQAGAGPTSAFAALGGSLIGGLTGAAVEHATADADAYEYIVKKTNGELVSVTQKDRTPLPLGSHVLVIAGNQARITPDYTFPSIAAEIRPTKPAGAGTDAKASDTAKADAAAAGDGALPASVSAVPPAMPSVPASTVAGVPASGGAAPPLEANSPLAAGVAAVAASPDMAGDAVAGALPSTTVPSVATSSAATASASAAAATAPAMAAPSVGSVTGAAAAGAAALGVGAPAIPAKSADSSQVQ